MFSQEPWIVVPLKTHDGNHSRQSFPRFSNEDDASYESVSAVPSSVVERVRKRLQSLPGLGNDIKHEIIVSLYLCLEGRHQMAGRYCIKDCKANDGVEKNDNDDKEEEEDEASSSVYPIAKMVWAFISDRIELCQWISLLTYVKKRLLVIAIENPLVQYATTKVPTLSGDELRQLRQSLFPGGMSNDVSVLGVMKQIQDHVESNLYGVLLSDPAVDGTTTRSFQHSCLPNGAFDMVRSSGKTRVSITALYDMDSTDEVSVCLIEDHEVSTVEEREAAVYRRFGRACACVRCRYEATESTECLDLNDAIRLGHFYFARGRVEHARTLYKHALAMDEDNWDLWHALGAIELSLGKFLEAQRMWKRAAHLFPASCEAHEGIALQMKKMECYKYFRDPVPRNHFDIECSWRSIVPQAYVTVGLVDAQICRQILKWAETGSWTQQRHYAVPTHDVPVHTVPPLLEWFNGFMKTTMRPLLAKQFNSSPNYYVHDAFCVRYEAGQVSNHLPIHTDESTHSFVLALNQDYSGGGTHFYDHNTTVRLNTGDVLSFRGDKLFHGGEAVARGKRYIIAAFLYHDDDRPKTSDVATLCGRKRPSSGMAGSFSVSKENKKTSDFSFAFSLEG